MQLRKIRAALVLAAALAATAFGALGAAGVGDTAAAPGVQAGGAGGPLTTLGTITARLNGEPRTWYVVGDGANDTGTWTELNPGERLIAVAGFDTATPPVASFTRDTAGRVTSYGGYDGSMLAIIVNVGADPQPFRSTIPFDRYHSFVYVADARQLDPARGPEGALRAIRIADTGTLEVTSIGFVGGRAFLEGTFSGTLNEAAPGSTPLAVTDLRFEAKNLPQAGAARP